MDRSSIVGAWRGLECLKWNKNNNPYTIQFNIAATYKITTLPHTSRRGEHKQFFSSSQNYGAKKEGMNPEIRITVKFWYESIKGYIEEYRYHSEDLLSIQLIFLFIWVCLIPHELIFERPKKWNQKSVT